MPKNIVVIGPPGTGKCVVTDTLVLTTDGLLKIGTLADRLGEGLTVPLENTLVPGVEGIRRAAGFYDGGVKLCCGIRTRKGFELSGTMLHPVLGLFDGEIIWRRLGDLRPGDRIAIASGTLCFPKSAPTLPEAPQFHRGPPGRSARRFSDKVTIPETMSEDLAEWLAWFILEGCWYPSNYRMGIGFCNYSKTVVERMDRLSFSLFNTHLWDTGDGRNFRITPLRLKHWLEMLGVAGLAAQKRVPDVVLRSPESFQRVYLRSIFEAEGSISLERRQVEFSTASEEMAKQVQIMLLNFGIVTARFKGKEILTKRWGRRRYSRLSMTGNHLLLFRERLGFMSGGQKQAKLETVVAKLSGWDLHGLPADFVGKRYAELRQAMASDERPRSFWREAKAVARSMGGKRRGQRIVARETVERGLVLFSDYGHSEPYREIKKELEGGRFWDEVAAVANLGEREVVDLVVPDGHSFVGNGVFCHNTENSILVASGWFKSGAAPDGVAYLSFTNAAADEATSRIKDNNLGLNLDLGEDGKLPFFRTLHSLAFRGLMRKKKEIRVISPADMKLFSAWSGYEGAFAVINSEDLADAYQALDRGGRTDYDKLLTAYNLSRISASIPEHIELAKTRMSRLASRTVGFIEDGTEAYKTFVKKYEDYKLANDLVDFGDMLAFALCEMDPIDSVRYAVIDECLPAGTPITLSDGRTKPIEDVTYDDTVLGYDHETGGLKAARVVETRMTTTTRLVKVNGDLDLTPNHPVFILGKGYVRAGNLKVGDRIIALQEQNSGRGVSAHHVGSAEEVEVPETHVYNIGTTTENYFANGSLVHNCQDLAPILHSIVDKLFVSADEVWWAGDPNQAIYGFAAADARLFIKRAQEADLVITLRQTHRFGQEIVDFSTKIIKRARDRILVDVIGFPGRSHNIRTTGDFNPTVEPMLILHRHVMGCQSLGADYMAEGKPFRNERGKDPLGSEMRVQGFQALHELAAGKGVSAGLVMRLVDDLMRSVLPPTEGTNGKQVRLVVHGGKKKMKDGALKGDVNLRDLVAAKILTQEGADIIRARNLQALKPSYVGDFEYYHRVVDNGYSLQTVDADGKTRVPIITTIHGSKGRQAPRVVVFSEFGQKCKEDMDNEHRLAYVASTRTYGSLEICAQRRVDYAEERYEYPVEQKVKPEEIDFDA